MTAALRPAESLPPELLYSTTDPYEIPLVMPAWARSVPALAERIDDGYALRRGAGLPVDGSLPERRIHRCDERCLCPADGLPMWYAPSTGQHACQDPDCAHAHPGGGDA